MIYTIIILVLIVLGVGMSLAEHGESRDGEYNFWLSLFVAALEIWLLYKAGVFNVFNY